MSEKVVKLVAISEPKTEKSREDGKVSRKYYTAKFADPLNPFAKQVSRNFWQNHDSEGKTAIWNGADPAAVKQFIGKTIPGHIATREVERYEIDQRPVDTYTTVILGEELESAVFKSLGHPLLGTSGEPAEATTKKVADAQPAAKAF